MKPILICLALMASALIVQAQLTAPSNPAINPSQQYLRQANQSDRATRVRMVGSFREYHLAGSWGNPDSIRYIYNSPNKGYSGAYYEFNYDSSISYNYSAGVWNPYYVVAITYTGDYPSVYEYYNISGSTITPGSKTLYTFNSNNKVTERLVVDWDGSAWVNSFKQTSVYDANNNETGTTQQTWGAGVWNNSQQVLRTYTAANNLSSYTRQQWTSGAWANDERTLYNIIGDNQWLDYTDQDWTGSNWVNTSKGEYTYTVDNKTDMANYFSWNGSAWDPTYRYSYIYGTNGLKSNVTSYQYSGSTWVNSSRTLYTYDSNDYMASETQQTYTAGAWQNTTRYQYVTGDEGFNTYNDYYTYSAGAWQPHSRANIYYEYYDDLSSVGDNPVINNTSVFPNPFLQNTIVSFNNPTDGEVNIKVQSLDGKIVFEKNAYYPGGQQQFLFDAEGLSKGMYLATISNGNAQTTIKLLKN